MWQLAPPLCVRDGLFSIMPAALATDVEATLGRPRLADAATRIVRTADMSVRAWARVPDAFASLLLLLPGQQRRTLCPGRNGLPVGIVLVGKLPATRMERIAARFRGERMDEDLAL
jgi:hypothetical protein